MSLPAKRVLVVVDADPRTSDRAIEALRMSVGIAAAENAVRVVLAGDAGLLLAAEREGLPGGARAAGFLDALERLGAEVGGDGDLPGRLLEADEVVRWTE